MLNLSSKVRLTCCLTSHLSACSKLLDLKATRSMWLFYSEKLQFQVASRALAIGSWKESFLTADFADVRGFWLGQSQIPSFQSSTGGVQFVFLGSVLRLTSINKVINSK